MKASLPLAVLVPIIFLQGCITAAVVSTAAIGTKLAIDPRTIGTQIDDSTLELRINNALSKDEQIKKKTRINAIVYQSKVLLIGQAPNIDLALRAKKITMEVNGITEVFNEIRHCKPINLSTASSDTWITAKVRSQLLVSDQIKSSNIKVKTENSEVFLLGIVTKREGRAAANIASRVNNVKHVTTAFSYIIE